MASIFDGLEPQRAWRIFELFCSVPHISGHVSELTDRLRKLAESHRLAVRQDRAGNLRVDRPAAPGLEKAPLVILQGHVDMVPACAPGKTFDFLHTPITPLLENGRIRADGTTLGADNGGGCALAMALLLDPELRCGPLAGLFTVDEEVGLVGAREVDASFLEGDCLVNLDGGDQNFCTGCAGGIRTDFLWKLREVPAPAGYSGYRITVTGLAGGHSGTEIHKRRGNALLYLFRFLAGEPSVAVSALEGGGADNAIPREGYAVTASVMSREELQRKASLFADALKKEFAAPPEFHIEVTSSPLPEKVWEQGFRDRLLAALAAVPDGVLAMAPAGDLVWTSSNFASIRTAEGTLKGCSSQRSMNDADRRKATEQLVRALEGSGAAASFRSEYPGWPPASASPLLKLAREVSKEVYGKEISGAAIHAGLECGYFALRNPRLDMISFGPEENAPHTDRESMSVISMQRTDRFLRLLLERLAR